MAFYINAVDLVDAYVANAWIAKQWTQWTKSENLIQYVLEKNTFFHHGQWSRVRVYDFTDSGSDLSLCIFRNIGQTRSIKFSSELIDNYLFPFSN